MNSLKEAGGSSGHAVRLVLQLIAFYRRHLSHLKPPSCRFYPTCSQYTYEAIERFGLWRGGWLGVKRVCRCHPFNKGGVDLVPGSWHDNCHAAPPDAAAGDSN